MTRGRRSVSLLGRRRTLPGTDNHPARRDAQTTTPGARPDDTGEDDRSPPTREGATGVRAPCCRRLDAVSAATGATPLATPPHHTVHYPHGTTRRGPTRYRPPSSHRPRQRPRILALQRRALPTTQATTRRTRLRRTHAQSPRRSRTHPTRGHRAARSDGYPLPTPIHASDEHQSSSPIHPRAAHADDTSRRPRQPSDDEPPWISPQHKSSTTQASVATRFPACDDHRRRQRATPTRLATPMTTSTPPR